MLIERDNFPRHRPWILFVAAATLGASAWFLLTAAATGAWPGGSSLPGFSFGVAGGLICIFEFLLWPRKKVRAWRLGRAQAWMRAHIWLGLLALPLLVYHSGFRLGGPLSTVLLALLVIVVVSGVAGLWLQNTLPRRMLEQVAAETVYSQIDYIIAQLQAEAADLVLATCGPDEQDPADHLAKPSEETAFLTIGAVRAVGQVHGKVLQTRVPRAPVPGSEPLRSFYLHTALPFLQGKAGRAAPLRSPNQAAMLFQDLKTVLAPAAHPAVDSLRDLCEQRRQFDLQRRLHLWLHAWLTIHLPLSVALMVLMVWHIYVALKYW